MDYQSPLRDRFESRSPTPKSRYSQSPSPVRRRRSPTRSPSPLPRRNGRFRSESRGPSRDREDRDDHDERDIPEDRGRSESPLRGSTKVSQSAKSSIPALLIQVVRFHLQIVVEKLTKTINEDHLQEIFGQYGPIRDLDMPVNRQCKLAFYLLFCFWQAYDITNWSFSYRQHEPRHSIHPLHSRG